MEPRKVLIVGMTPEKGGRETFVMDLFRRIDRSKIQFDFINTCPTKNIAFADEIQILGGKIIYIPMLRHGPIAHYRSMHRIFTESKYHAVYYNANSFLKNADIFRIADEHGVPLKILHSHNSSDLIKQPIIQKLRESNARRVIARYVTHYFSCSKEAGLWMFGEETPFTVINNGIDTARFDFYPEKREQIREANTAGGKTVYGTIARMRPEKNPFFLIDIFHDIHQMQPESVFWHIGGGSLEPQLREKITQLGLEDSFLLLGRKDNVEDYLNAMDEFLLPSIHEGFPITLVEAQTSGLRCLVADTITPDVDLTGNVTFMPLTQSPEKWAETAVELSSYPRASARGTITDKGFDVAKRVADFEQLILE